jgi:hypothetical protein
MRQSVVKEEENVQYILKRSSKRRTVGIKVAYDSVTTVYAPSWMRRSDIEHAVRKKADWIRKKQREFSRSCYPPVNRMFRDGETFYVLGDAYVLRYVPEKRKRAVGTASCDGENKHILLPVSADIYRSTVYSREKTGSDAEQIYASIRSAVADVYRKLGEAWLAEHEDYMKGFFFRKVSVEPAAAPISLRLMKSRWGSCRNDGSVILSLRLFGAPEYLIHYVVYHELCHLIHFNHSRDFYRVLSRLDPKWNEHRKELHGWAGRLIL